MRAEIHHLQMDVAVGGRFIFDEDDGTFAHRRAGLEAGLLLAPRRSSRLVGARIRGLPSAAAHRALRLSSRPRRRPRSPARDGFASRIGSSSALRSRPPRRSGASSPLRRIAARRLWSGRRRCDLRPRLGASPSEAVRNPGVGGGRAAVVPEARRNGRADEFARRAAIPPSEPVLVPVDPDLPAFVAGEQGGFQLAPFLFRPGRRPRRVRRPREAGREPEGFQSSRKSPSPTSCPSSWRRRRDFGGKALA